MNTRMTMVALAISTTVLTGCGTFGNFGKSRTGTDVTSGQAIDPGTQQAIADQRVVNDFRRQGIRVIFSLRGELEAIESVGYAPVRGNSQLAIRESYRMAEVEAKKSMNDFINRETITSSVSVAMISRNIEKATDNRTNRFASNSDAVSEVSDEEVTGTSNTANTAQRDDALNIAQRVNTNITVRNTGILGGMYLVEGQVINNGRTVRAVYRWDRRHAPVRSQVRSLMAQ